MTLSWQPKPNGNLNRCTHRHDRHEPGLRDEEAGASATPTASPRHIAISRISRTSMHISACVVRQGITKVFLSSALTTEERQDLVHCYPFSHVMKERPRIVVQQVWESTQRAGHAESTSCVRASPGVLTNRTGVHRYHRKRWWLSW